MEVPVVDGDEGALGAVRQCGVTPHLSGEVVGVRLNAVHLHVDRQDVPILAPVVGDSGRNVQVLLSQPDGEGNPGRRVGGEEEADARPHRLRLPARRQVQLQQQIRARIEGPGHALRCQRPHLSGRPAQEPAEGEARRERGDPVVARRRILRIQLPGGRRRIDLHVGVVHHPGISRLKLHALHVAPARDRNRNRELAQHVRPLRLERVRLRNLDYEVRLPEPPPAGRGWWRGPIPAIAFRRPGVHPGRDQFDLGVAQPLLADERPPVPGLRLPRRHRAHPYGVADGARPGPNLRVGEHAEGRYSVRAVTGGAAVMQERSDPIGEGDGLFLYRRRSSHDARFLWAPAEADAQQHRGRAPRTPVQGGGTHTSKHPHVTDLLRSLLRLDGVGPGRSPTRNATNRRPRPLRR